MIPLLRLVGCWRTGVASENRPASQKAGKSQAPKHLNKQRRTTLPLDQQRHPFCTKPTPPPPSATGGCGAAPGPAVVARSVGRMLGSSMVKPKSRRRMARTSRGWGSPRGLHWPPRGTARTPRGRWGTATHVQCWAETQATQGGAEAFKVGRGGKGNWRALPEK